MLKIKSDEIVIVANKLERNGKYELPVVVRSTLNNLAFEMKKANMPKAANEKFDYNRTNIVKALGWVTKASGNNIKTMKSQAGIRLRSGKQKVAKGLAAQESGGKLSGKTTPTIKARGGGCFKEGERL